MPNFITPDRYSSVSAYDLLVAAGRGHIGFDNRLLHALLDEPSKTLPGIVQFSLEDRDDDRVDLDEDLIRVALYLHAPEMIPFLVDRVQVLADDAPDDLVQALCGFREAALEPLLDLYRSISEPEDTEIPFLLAALGVKDERIEAILHRLSERDPSEASVCLEIYRQIAGTTPNSPPYEIWEEYPEEAEPPFELLELEERLEFLDSESPKIRRAAVASYFTEPELTAPVVARLTEVARTDAAAEVRGAAWKSLAIETEDDEELQDEMRARLHDAETPALERAGLVVALASDAVRQEVRDKVLELFDQHETRADAIAAMWRSGDRTYTTYVRKGLDESDVDIREQALLGVGHLGLAGELGRVKAMMEDPNLRPTAVMAYALAMPSEVTPARMRSLFKKIEETAGGLSPEEADLIHMALDHRLLAHGKEPIYDV